MNLVQCALLSALSLFHKDSATIDSTGLPDIFWWQKPFVCSSVATQQGCLLHSKTPRWLISEACNHMAFNSRAQAPIVHCHYHLWHITNHAPMLHCHYEPLVAQYHCQAPMAHCHYSGPMVHYHGGSDWSCCKVFLGLLPAGWEGGGKPHN